jgi:hypothetical protein
MMGEIVGRSRLRTAVATASLHCIDDASRTPRFQYDVA